MEADQIATWVEILTPAVVVIGALWRYEKKLSSRLDAQDAATAAITKTLDVQFGGNGGGMREAINAQGKALDDVSTRLDAHISQHITRRY